MKSQSVRSLWGVIIIAACFLALVVFMTGADLIAGLPSLEQLENPKPDLATTVFTADGQLLGKFKIKNRAYIPYDSIPKNFVKALVATEDKNFYEHWGVSLERSFKALVKLVISFGSRKEGASTITQQLARNVYLTFEQTLWRKIREQITAVQIERAYTKNEIIEMYANTVYFGNSAYGIQVASEFYFNKPPYQLTLEECAYLVALLKSPENYDAIDHPKDAKSRRDLVMSLMLERGFITGNEYRIAASQPINLVEQKEEESYAGGYFKEHLRRTWSKKLHDSLKVDLYRDGLTIYTTLDTRMQAYANQAVVEHLNSFQRTFDRTWSWKRRDELLKRVLGNAIKNNPKYKAADSIKKPIIWEMLSKDAKFVDSIKRVATQIQSSLTVIEAKTGYVRAMVGSRDTNATGMGLNRSTDMIRQPGSSFKPFVYASAMQNSGLTPNSIVNASSFTYRLPGGGVWRPKGSGGGAMALRQALKFSVNTVAARLIVGPTNVRNVIKLCRELGLSTVIPEVPSIALGSAEVRPIEIVNAYNVFPNEGVFVPYTLVTKIEDRYGNVIYDHKPGNLMKEVLKPRVAGGMVSMMQDVVNGGTAKTIRNWYGGPAAGKTGTTQDFADAWFIGYTPELVAGVWVGFDEHKIKFTGWYGQGGSAAAPVWGRFMSKIYNDEQLPYGNVGFSKAPIAPGGGGFYRPRYSTNKSTEIKNSDVKEDLNDVQEGNVPPNEGGGGGNQSGNSETAPSGGNDPKPDAPEKTTEKPKDPE